MVFVARKSMAAPIAAESNWLARKPGDLSTRAATSETNLVAYISPGECKSSSVDCGRKSGIVVAVSWFRHCWPCSSQNPDKIQVVTGVTPQAKPGSHTIERVNHAPARKVTAPASSIMEEASETP